jgi:hypothetical protein
MKVLSLEDYSKGFWLGFLPLLRRVSQDTSCVLVYGVSSCDIGCCEHYWLWLSEMLK